MCNSDRMHDVLIHACMHVYYDLLIGTGHSSKTVTETSTTLTSLPLSPLNTLMLLHFALKGQWTWFIYSHKVHKQTKRWLQKISKKARTNDKHDETIFRPSIYPQYLLFRSSQGVSNVSKSIPYKCVIRIKGLICITLVLLPLKVTRKKLDIDKLMK